MWPVPLAPHRVLFRINMQVSLLSMHIPTENNKQGSCQVGAAHLTCCAKQEHAPLIGLYAECHPVAGTHAQQKMSQQSALHTAQE